jgi:DNA-binding transcriptional LysR family regulator
VHQPREWPRAHSQCTILRQIVQSGVWIAESRFPMMELTHLRMFVTVADLQHLTQAAERLHVSQPAASAHIKALEEALGVSLFERRVGGLALTNAGRELVEYARDVLAASATLRSKAREIAQEVRGRFRLGARVDTELIPLGALARATRQRYPKLDLEIEEMSSLNILGAIQSGELDAGFPVIGRLPPTLTGVNLRPIRYRVVGPADWRDVIGSADRDALSKLPWIGAPRGGSHDQMLLEFFGKATLSLSHVVEAAQEAVHATLVEAGVGLALMREDRAVAAEKRGAATIWPGGSTTSMLHYVYAEKRAKDPAVQALKEIAAEIFKVENAGKLKPRRQLK